MKEHLNRAGCRYNLLGVKARGTVMSVGNWSWIG